MYVPGLPKWMQEYINPEDYRIYKTDNSLAKQEEIRQEVKGRAIAAAKATIAKLVEKYKLVFSVTDADCRLLVQGYGTDVYIYYNIDDYSGKLSVSVALNHTVTVGNDRISMYGCPELEKLSMGLLKNDSRFVNSFQGILDSYFAVYSFVEEKKEERDEYNRKVEDTKKKMLSIPGVSSNPNFESKLWHKDVYDLHLRGTSVHFAGDFTPEQVEKFIEILNG